jgi:hypothetical protein
MTALPTGQQLSDTISRTNLLLARRGLLTDLTAAGQWFALRGVHIDVGADACQTPSGQAAALTAVTLARRAGLPVTANAIAGDSPVHTGPWRNWKLSAALTELGAIIAAAGQTKTVVTIGDALAPPADVRLQVSWDAWIASVRPDGVRLAERDGCALAPIAAAALAVSEIFHHHIGHLDAAYRPVALSLWHPLSPTPETAPGPALARLPNAWMLVGLGHLGQANAWCLSNLPYADGRGELWLVDDDLAAPANISTGVLTTASDVVAGPVGTARRKTRIVAAAAERAGRPTRLVEQRLPSTYRYEPGQADIALIGVDNIDLRRRLTDFGWPLCVDAGLGAGPSSFDTISIHTFPSDTCSRDIQAWQQPRRSAVDVDVAAFDALLAAGLDQCGVVMLAGQAVAAAFVGMLAACLTVAEVLRRTCGAAGLDALSTSLDIPSPRGASARPGIYRGQLVPIDAAVSESLA